jgi:hypothetical protein
VKCITKTFSKKQGSFCSRELLHGMQGLRRRYPGLVGGEDFDLIVEAATSFDSATI